MGDGIFYTIKYLLIGRPLYLVALLLISFGLSLILIKLIPRNLSKRIFQMRNFRLDLILNGLGFAYLWMNVNSNIIWQKTDKLLPSFWAVYFSIRIMRPFKNLDERHEDIANQTLLMFLGWVAFSSTQAGYFGGLSNSYDWFSIPAALLAYLEALERSFGNKFMEYFGFVLGALVVSFVVAGVFRLLCMPFKKPSV